MHNRITGLVAVFTERYVLSAMYFYFATNEFKTCAGLWSGRLASGTTVFIDATHHLIMLLLCLFTGLLLLFGRRADVPPQQLKLILVPLAAAFFNFLYYTVAWFPASWQRELGPPAWQLPLLAAGLVCILLGPLIALWGLIHLGRSFGVYVTVRKVVLTGPYQWVRHPMYLGWVCLYCGIALANFSGAYFLLVALNIGLLLCRAQLEQTQLAAHSEEYREYMQHTRFIFPKLRNPLRRQI